MAGRSLLQFSTWRGVPLGLACALVAYLATFTSWHHGVNEWTLDGLFVERGPRPTTANVILVGLDDESLREFRKPLVYLSPELAGVVTHLKASGAAAVGIDLMIPEDLSAMPEIADDGGVGDARTLGRAINDAGNIVLPEWAILESPLRPLSQWCFKADLDPDGMDLGFVDLTDDPDRFIRRQGLAAEADGAFLPAFALAILGKARGHLPAWDDDARQLSVGDQIIPLDDEQRMRINYAGPPGTFRVVSFRDVLANARANQPMPEFEGAMVIIGVTARGSQDFHSTPYSNRYAQVRPTDESGLMNGPEIHAHVLSTLVDQAYLSTPWWLRPIPLFLVCGALLGAAIARFGIEWGLLVTLAYYFGWKYVAVLLFAEYGYTFSLVGVRLLGVMVFVVAVTLRWRLLRRVLRAVKSQPIAKAFEADPRSLRLGGELRIVTVLFADVRGFTSFSERHKTEPRKVVALLNAYFTEIVPLIEAHGGTLNQYMGDGIMVLFNAPETQPDHATRAVRAAVAIVRAVRANQSRWAKLGFDGMKIGVGINTGDAVVGAVGSPQRLDYTAIGDTTNTAARVEAENKQHGTEILISERTFLAIPDGERVALGVDESAPITPVGLKGKSESIRLFAVDPNLSAAARGG